MCLTIPKKVISIDGNNAVVENPNGDRQTVKTIVKLSPGEFCLTQQNVAIEKIDNNLASEMVEIIRRGIYA